MVMAKVVHTEQSDAAYLRNAVDTGKAHEIMDMIRALDSAAERQRRMSFDAPANVTLRDWYAGLALQGLSSGNMSYDGMVSAAYSLADRMIQHRLASR